jgi:preprotein translocase subunit SecE
MGSGGGELAVAGAGGGDIEKPPVRLSPTPPEGQGSASARNWGWGGNFIRESIAELRKVEWPGQSQVVQGTVVVIIACVIIGSYLYLCDQVFSKLVQKILLRQ